MDTRRVRAAQVAVAGLFIGIAGACWPAGSAAAQSGGFCPAGFTLINGFCVSQPFAAQPPCPPGMGPVSFGPTTFACVGNSSASAASQSLTTNLRSITDQSIYSTLNTVRARAEEESQRCPAGSRRVNGVCTPTGGRAIGFANESAQGAYAADIGANRVVMRPTAQVPGLEVHPAIWLQGFYDHESRKETTPNNTPTFGGVNGTLLPPGGLTTSTVLDRNTNTFGFLSGIDFTFMNVTGNSDVLIVGALAGYTSSHVKFKALTQTTDVTGPSGGVFAAYVRGPISTDVTFKADFLTQDQQFVDFGGGAAQIAGTNSIRLNTYSVAGNANYKIPLNNDWYFEPTVGAIYSDTEFAAGAAALGLSDTQSTRVQGGARVGTTWKFANITVSSNLTGIAFSNVSITGGSTAAAGAVGQAQTDEGKVYGQFLLANNYDLGAGWSASSGSDIRFGNGVLGIGAKAGLRYQW